MSNFLDEWVTKSIYNEKSGTVHSATLQTVPVVYFLRIIMVISKRPIFRNRANLGPFSLVMASTSFLLTSLHGVYRSCETKKV